MNLNKKLKKMKIAILSDIHSNLEALEAVVNNCQEMGVAEYYCGGDVVGYGANPKECIERLHQLKAITVAGNHDWAVAGRIDASYFTEDGKQAIAWTRSNISFEDITFLSTLPLIHKTKNFILTHADLNNPQNFNYLNNISDVSATSELMDRTICFIGHTHVPNFFISKDDKSYQYNTFEMEINPDYNYIVNTGSVGQPRDGNPMASFAIFDTQINTVEIRRVQYNIDLAQKKIIDKNLPEFLAARLSFGK